MIRAALAIAVAVAVGCLVDRKSSGFACESDTQCASDRRCDRGYCVEGARACPAICPDCNLGNRICNVACASANQCDDVTCPAGFTCNITCSVGNACNNIDCTQAKACTVTCSANNACDDVDCGAGPCRVTCNAASACRDIDCSDSCKCDVLCQAGQCDSMFCPDRTSGSACDDGTAQMQCTSSASGCSTCQ